MQLPMGKEREGTCYHNEMCSDDRRLEVMVEQNAKPLASVLAPSFPLTLLTPQTPSPLFGGLQPTVNTATDLCLASGSQMYRTTKDYFKKYLFHTPNECG